MNYLATLEEIYNYVKVPDAPTEKGIITGNALWRLYAEIFPNQTDKIFVGDREYSITAISELRRFVNWSTVNRYPWIENIHDCDDFAKALAGEFAKYPGWSEFPATDIWGNLYGGHAFFTAVAWPSFEDRTPTVYYIEPQTDWEISAEVVENMELWLIAFT